MTRITHVEPGLYVNMSNEDYHRAPGVSNTALKYVAKNPSDLIWYWNAPVDDQKVADLDEGQLCHTWLLEPDEYHKRFLVGDQYDRRTKKGKEEYQAFIERAKSENKTPIDHEIGRKAILMRDSVMAHPTARWIFEQEGSNESSIFVIDEETDELLKVRPDRKIMPDGRIIIVDVKKTAEFDRFHWAVKDYRYHVQKAMYSDVVSRHYGADSLFWFLRVSSKISCGRYPVGVDELSDDLSKEGHEIYRRDLQTYHECKEQNDWIHVGTITTRKY